MVWRRTRCAPLPLVGRGWGWGSELVDITSGHNNDPHPARFARHPPHKGEGRTEFSARADATAPAYALSIAARGIHFGYGAKARVASSNSASTATFCGRSFCRTQ